MSKRTREDDHLADTDRQQREKRGPSDRFDPVSSLCLACRRLDIDVCFAKAYEHYEKRPSALTSKVASKIYQGFGGTYFYDDAFPVHQFGSRLSTPSSCPLCQFFGSFVAQRSSHKRHKLLAFRTSDCWLFRADWLRSAMKQWTREDAGLMVNDDPTVMERIYLAVVPDNDWLPDVGHEVNWLDHLCPTTGVIFGHSGREDDDVQNQGTLLSARELKAHAEIGRVRNYLRVCRDNHHGLCQQRTSQEPITRAFRLINCTLDTPVVEDKPWGTQYAALSYVWGQAESEDWPRTVLDAVEVAKELGMPHLWVDRLCINQDDTDEKIYLIERMTTIYEEADFTIVAAADGGASRGLPGVRSTPRRPQPKYYLDNGTLLLSTMPDPRREIIRSDYWTRGWTYQEGVLSNRRVVFTESQVYWECRCMVAYESVDYTLYHTPAAHNDDPDSIMASYMLTGIFKGRAHLGGVDANEANLRVRDDDDYHLDYGFPINRDLTITTQLRALDDHIREVSKRRLTNDADSLLAFKGIVGMYKQTKSLFLMHGIPIWLGKLAGGEDGPHFTFALSVSSWYHHSSSVKSMFSSEACRRRPHMPSWSWAGWEGTVTWRAPPMLEHSTTLSEIIHDPPPRVLWAADLHVCSSNAQASVRLCKDTPEEMVAHVTSIGVSSPWILDSYECRKADPNRQWSWKEGVGRPGRERISVDNPTWDKEWFRIGRRLAVVGMSISITQREWTAKHVSGELVSVLIFSGRYPNVERHQSHGTARYLTLRRVQLAIGEVWERVGTLYLTIPFLADCDDVTTLFKKIPARRHCNTIVIQ